MNRKHTKISAMRKRKEQLFGIQSFITCHFRNLFLCLQFLVQNLQQRIYHLELDLTVKICKQVL